MRNSHSFFLSSSFHFLQHFCRLYVYPWKPVQKCNLSAHWSRDSIYQNPLRLRLPAVRGATWSNFLCMFSQCCSICLTSMLPPLLTVSYLAFSSILLQHIPCTLTPRPHLHACLPFFCIPPGRYISLTQFAVPFLCVFSLPAAPTVSGMSIFSCPLPGPHIAANGPLASLMAFCLLPNCK